MQHFDPEFRDGLAGRTHRRRPPTPPLASAAVLLGLTAAAAEMAVRAGAASSRVCV